MEDVKPKSVKVKRMVEVEKPKTSMKPVQMVSPDQAIRYSEQVQVDTHLFKLVEAPVIKYLGKEKEANVDPVYMPQDFVHMGHAHIFRTTDSDGKKHTKCVPIGGHYHIVELDPNVKEGEAPRIIAMSGPMKTQAKKVGGREILVDVPLNHFDDHTHEVLYIKSEKVEVRKSNIDAAKFMAQESSRIPAITGVSEAGGR